MDRINKIIWEYLFADVWISAGTDCHMPTILRETGNRKFASPFDWCVTYGPLQPIFQNEFKNWCKVSPKVNERDTNQYGVFFAHDSNYLQPDEQKYQRRIQRLLGIMKDETKFKHIFRQSHKKCHHGGDSKCSLNMSGPDCSLLSTNDVKDVIELSRFRECKNTKIWLFLTCDQCYSKEPERQTPNMYVEIFNLTGKGKIEGNSTNEEINNFVLQFVKKIILNSNPMISVSF